MFLGFQVWSQLIWSSSQIAQVYLYLAQLLTFGLAKATKELVWNINYSRLAVIADHSDLLRAAWRIRQKTFTEMTSDHEYAISQWICPLFIYDRRDSADDWLRKITEFTITRIHR